VIVISSKYKSIVVYDLYGVCVQMSISIYVIRRDLVHMWHVMCIMSGGEVYPSAETCRSLILVMNCILLSAFVG
jgi:hypothetical protein